MTRLVCTAGRRRRQGCGDLCDGCSFLMTDRRSSHLTVARNDLCERRIMSNLLPVGVAALAGAGGLSMPSQIPTRRRLFLGWLPVMMVLLIAFNLLDVILTARALSLGVTEANPVMAGLFNLNLSLGMIIKFIFVSSGAAVLWKFRRLPVAVRGMYILAFCYAAVVAYHAVFQLSMP